MRALGLAESRCVLFLQCEDVDVENAVAVGSIAEEVGELFGLLVVFVVDGLSVLPPSQRCETRAPSFAPGSWAPAGSVSRGMWQVWQVKTASLR